MLGLPAVEAVFVRDAATVERLFVLPELAERVRPLTAALAAARKPFRIVEGDELARVAGTVLHGGICAVARPPRLRPLPVSELADWAGDGQPLFVLDGVGNPHNLGAIARTLAFFGLKRLVLSGHPAQALPSEAAVRVAEGGLSRLSLYTAPDLRRALDALRPHYSILGTALDTERPLTPATLERSRPCVVVLGNEEHGLPPETLAACDRLLTLPGSGWVQSLNVSATAAILAHDLLRDPPPSAPPQRSKSAPARTGHRR